MADAGAADMMAPTPRATKPTTAVTSRRANRAVTGAEALLRVRRAAHGPVLAGPGLGAELLVSLPRVGGRERRLMLVRERGDVPFSERDRLLLTLVRPHLVSIRDRVEAQRRVAGIELTPRQWQLLERVAVGATNRQIARELGLSEGTVRKHLDNIYARLGVGSRTEALARVRADGPLAAAGASSV